MRSKHAQSSDEPLILVVDNDDAYRITLTERLKREGYRTIEAASPSEAELALARVVPLLAIIDIRLMDDLDERDKSGIELARSISERAPVILLTAWPTVDDVRRALQPYGPPSAVAFAVKGEGQEQLLQYVRLVLAPLPASLEKRMLQAFNANMRVGLIGRIQELGADETFRRLREVFDRSEVELRELRRSQNARAAQYHYFAMGGIGLGIVIVFTAIGLFLSGRVTAAVISLVVSIVIKILSALLLYQERTVHERVARHQEELVILSRIATTCELINTLETAAARDEYRKRIIDQILERSVPSEGRKASLKARVVKA